MNSTVFSCFSHSLGKCEIEFVKLAQTRFHKKQQSTALPKAKNVAMRSKHLNTAQANLVSVQKLCLLKEDTMSLSSPTQSLCKLIERLKQAVEFEAEALSTSLLATRLMIIEPILQELGWDIHNQDELEIENHATSCIYKLKDEYLNTWLELHCVAFDQPLARPNYSSTNNVILSNGNTWASSNHSFLLHQSRTFDFAVWLITHFDRQQIRPSSTTEFSLGQISESIANMVEDVNNLKKHLPTNQSIALPLESISPKMPPAADINRVIRKLQLQATQAKEKYPEPDDPRFIVFEKAIVPHRVGPNFLRLPNNKVLEVKQWSRLLVEVCKYVLDHNPNISFPVKDRAGKKVNLLSLEPVNHLTSSTIEYQGQTVYVFTNYNANNCILNARHALSLLPDSAKQVEAAVIMQDPE
jgi:hypothetical protein